MTFPGMFSVMAPLYTRPKGLAGAAWAMPGRARRDRTASFAKNVFMGGFLSVFAAGQKPVFPEAARLFSFFLTLPGPLFVF